MQKEKRRQEKKLLISAAFVAHFDFDTLVQTGKTQHPLLQCFQTASADLSFGATKKVLSKKDLM